MTQRRPAALAGSEAQSPLAARDWARNFVIFQFACQLALLFDLFGSYRILVRAAAFGSSLLLLFMLPKGRGRAHPSVMAAYWVMIILGLSFFHPTTNSLLVGSAQILLYLAILGPLFWIPRLHIDMAGLRRVLLVIFIFHTISATAGVLQARFPGRFQPSLSTTIASQGRGYVEGLKITLASGQRVFRPMGLTDVPGGAAIAGLYTVLFGIGFYLTSRRKLMRLLCLGSIALGMVCLYLAQVRSILIITAISVLAFCGLLLWQNRTTRLLVLGGLLLALIALSFTYAVSIGGKSVTTRMSTLVADRPGSVYYKNRGIFLEETINVLLPQYPLGAGLGRWGMMNAYFGNETDPERGPIYAEIQWTGWLLDGGIPLILAYVVALVLALMMALKIALNRNAGDLYVWGGIVLAYSAGALATTFNYPLFIGQGGMEFWLLNALLFAAARTVIPQLGKSKALQR
jgi:hypothetical protein